MIHEIPTSYNMNPTKMIRQLSHVTRPPKILRLGLWRVPQQCKTSANITRSKATTFLESSTENSKESLLASEFSDSEQGGSIGPPQQVPKGFLAVYVGPEQRRFVIPMSYLSMPEFRVLMDQVAEEFGFEQDGGLQIPCEEHDFEEILVRCLRMHKMASKSKKKNIFQ